MNLPMGIENGPEIMKKRLLAERIEELEKNLKKKKKYTVCFASKFEGYFGGIEEENGEFYAVFTQDGRTDRGSVPTRKIRINELLSAELIKK